MARTGFRMENSLSGDKPSMLGPLMLAVTGGVLQTLSWPTPGYWPLCFVALIPLLLAVDGQSGKRAFFYGWVYGLTLAVGSLPWLADVLAGYGGLGVFLGWFIFLLLAMFLAIFQGLFGWLATLNVPRPFWWAVCGAICWCGLDWLKNWVFTGFNWTPLAGPLALSPDLSQVADIFGFYGLGFFVALINFFLTIVIFKRMEKKPAEGNIYLAGTLVLILGAFAYGWHAYDRWDNAVARADVRVVATVQPSTDQIVKWDDKFRDDLLARLGLLGRKADGLDPWLVVWPETAMPFLYDYDFVESQWLRQMSKDAGSPILAGIAGLGGFWPEQKMHNRMVLLNKGELVAYYDKMHLVPFGEYLPLDWLPFLKWAFMQGLIGEAGTYDPGSPMPLIEVPLSPGEPGSRKIRLGLLICFESTFPYLGKERALQGAELLIVPTNDGWFGRSRAPRQHLYQAVMRAVETRRPLVRAGNTGISGLIYPTGQIAWQSGLYDIGAYPLTTPILKPDDLSLTLFVKGGYLMAPIMAALTGLLAFIRLFRRG